MEKEFENGAVRSEDGEMMTSFEMLNEKLLNKHRINPNLYVEFDVKRGLRDSAGKGVLTGLTEISDVSGYELVNGRQIPSEGKLYYQGVNVNELINGLKGRKYGFEETVYLLLFRTLPGEKDMKKFLEVFYGMQELKSSFVRDVVMKASSENIMNALQRCVLSTKCFTSTKVS